MVEPNNIKMIIWIPSFQQITAYYRDPHLLRDLCRPRIWLTPITIKIPPAHRGQEIPLPTPHV
jgi:hypothetical protein